MQRLNEAIDSLAGKPGGCKRKDKFGSQENSGGVL